MASANPGGSVEGDTSEMVYGALPPATPGVVTRLVLAIKSPRYAVGTPPIITTAVGSPLIIPDSGGTNSVKDRTTTAKVALLNAVTVIVKVPVVVGMPESKPVLAFSINPAGSPAPV